ncbi:unnamed protein product [Phytophthora lilii]|uniref:Unnamed protein product n=1 Tax=Phytophthora lilii TaxID=2077276 RepID=A0A9W6TE41_9STRA|nr:unnamed protein product [Phytophthora lilii]
MSEDDQCFELRGQTADVEEDFRESEWPFSGRGKLDDVPIPNGGACVEISNVLGRAAEHTRDFSFGGQAASLPAVMGLLVDGVGNVSLPICRQQAEELIACCEKSPFGHNMNTVMDERVRKSWQLGPSALTIKNPLWHSGIEELSKLVGERLGYQRIPLQCVLYKLLLYGEGGHFEKHQDTEKEDGMIATLVVQPPSLHEGGDLVVYRCGKEKYRQDFGKADGTAPFLPHYAVHYADAEHAVERVTSGYRVVLVYSICLPTNMRHLERDLNKPMDGDLAVAISKMDTGNDFFSLLLSHEYTSKSIENFGSAAFKGVDRARFHALQQANIQAPSDKKLHFFIAKLRHKVEYLGNGGERIGDWKEWCRTESVTWYSTSGDFIGESDNVPIKLNFLNPCAETLSQLWKPHGSSDIQGYMGNEGPNKDTTYGRYAIVAWPIARHLQHTLELLSLDVAAVTLEAEKPVGQEEFRRFVDAAKVKLAAMDVEHQAEQKRRYSWKDTSRQYAFVSTRVCNALCRMLIEIGNPALVYPFFTNFIVRLKDKSNVMKYVTRIIEAFEWRDLGQALLQFVSGKNENYVMEAAMQVVELWTLIFCHCDEDTLKMLTRNFMK